MLSTYAALGMGVTASRYFAEAKVVQRDGEKSPVGLMWIISILISVIFSVALYIIPDGWLEAGLDVPRSLLVFGVFALAINVVPAGGVLGLERYREASLISGAAGLSVVLAALYATVKASIEIAMMGVISAILLQALCQSILVFRVYGYAKIIGEVSFKLTEFQKIVGFAGPMFFVSLLSASGAWLVGRLILDATNDHQFSLYSIGMQWYALGLLMPGIISRVFLPRLVLQASGIEKHIKQEAGLLVRMSVGLSLFLSIGMVFVVLILSPWLADLYGNKYVAIRWVLVSFMVAATLTSPVSNFGNALVANDGQSQWLLLTIVSTSVLLLTALATGWMGVWSGVISLSISGLTLSVLSAFALRKKKLI
jgi:O-antigen/teichoic acid export membrane protein